MYGAVVCVLLAAKPSCAFTPEGRLREFGAGSGRTPFSLGVLTSAAAVFSSLSVGLAELARLGAAGA